MVDTRSTRRTQAPSTVPPPAKKRPKKTPSAARGNGAPVNDTSTQQAPLAPVENGEQNEDPTTAKQSEDIEPAANDQTSRRSLRLPSRSTPSTRLTLLVFSRLLRLCDPNPGRSRVPSNPTRRETLSISLAPQTSAHGWHGVQPVADEDELEELVKGREDRDEDELPDIPREDAEEEDWDIDLPAQDAAGALEATYTVQPLSTGKKTLGIEPKAIAINVGTHHGLLV
ncbi:hypothetical protein B0H14DRAFT_2643517 [Mycena olivaceomarginata]|nr:hypothetical protein B0H14DRAFT_2643517 [Mycena olivaceomarginata]